MNRFFSTLILIFISFLAASTPVYKVFSENGKQGLKDSYGKVVIPPQYDALGWTLTGHEVRNNRIGFQKDNKWGLVSVDNKILYPATLEAIFDATPNHIIAGKKNINGRYKKGILSYDGELVIPFDYNHLKIFETNIIAVKDNSYGLLNFRNNEVLPFKYKNIEHVGDLRWMVWNEENKGALFSNEGKKLTDFKIDSIYNFSSGFAKAWVGHKVGLLNRDGKWVLPADYKFLTIRNEIVDADPFHTFSLFTNGKDLKLHVDSIKILKNGYIHAFAGNNEWLLNKNFEKISPVGSAIKVSEKLIAIRENSLYRIFDLRNSSWWSENYFQDVRFLNDSIFIGKLNTVGINTWQLYAINNSSPLIFGIEDVEFRFDGLMYKKKNAWGYIDESGEVLLPAVYDLIDTIKEDKFLVRFHKFYGVINSKEEWLIPPIKEELLDFNNHGYVTFDGLNYNFYNFRGDRIYFSRYYLSLKKNFVEEQIDSKNFRRLNFKGLSIQSAFVESGYEEVLPLQEGFIGIYHQGMYGFIDPQNRLRIANRYEGIQSFQQGIASVKIRGKWGAINKEERLIIQPSYDSIGYFNNGITIVKEKDKYGMINSSGKIILSTEYDLIKFLKKDFFLIKKDDKSGVINQKGNIIIWPKYENILYKNDFFIVSKDNRYGLHDKDGLAILPPEYEQIIPQYDQDFIIGKKNKTVRADLY